MAREEGISKLTLFEVLDDNPVEAPSFGTPFSLPWAINFETEDEYMEGEYKADNIIEQIKNQIAKVNVKMEVSSDTPPTLDSKLTGKGYKNGMSFKNKQQENVRYAVAYEILMSDGNLRRRVVYNVGFKRNGQTNETQGEDTGKTYTYDGIGIPLASTGDVEGIMDLKELKTLTDGVEKTKALARWNNFFKKVILPDTEIPETPPAGQ